MKVSIIKNNKDKDYYTEKGLRFILKPFYISFESKKRTVGFHFFNRNRMSPRPKYRGFKPTINLFDMNGHCHWIELSILNWIASLRIDTLYGKKSFEIWKRKGGIA